MSEPFYWKVERYLDHGLYRDVERLFEGIFDFTAGLFGAAAGVEKVTVDWFDGKRDSWVDWVSRERQGSHAQAAWPGTLNEARWF